MLTGGDQQMEEGRSYPASGNGRGEREGEK